MDHAGAIFDDDADRLAAQGRYAEAAATQRVALSLGTSDFPEGRELLAWYLLKAGEEDEAAELWRELLAEHPGDPGVELTAGIAYLDADRPAEAIGHLTRAIELSLDGERTDAYVLRQAAGRRRRAEWLLARQPDAVDERAAGTLAALEARRTAA
ncbi:MAG TPA: tetratricopeptide repeat protein [Solirubrobacteraceae bacterium]|nr:tetratricopeptide repeat protein [Solirubrobacteraceae bacterium]